MIFNHRRITQTPKEGATILKSWCPEMLFLVFWENIFCLKYLLNRLPFLCLFLFARCQVQVIFLYIILRGFFYIFWISGSVKNTLNIRCLFKNSFENTRTYVKIRFFLSWWHIGLAFQAKYGEYQWNQDGWTVCFLLDCWTISWLAPLCVSVGMCFVMLNHGWTNTQGL